jgi:very-short-patch-repair endonuclease
VTETVAGLFPNMWAQVPTDRVVRIDGLTEEQIAVTLDPLPDAAPVVIRYHLSLVPSTAAALIDQILGRLDEVARGLFPDWLPGSKQIDGTSDLDRRVVRQLAYRLAKATPHFGPFLADVAEAALVKRPALTRFGPETRARGLCAIIAAAYSRDRVVLMIDGIGDLSPDEQRRVGATCEWLVNHGTMGVWLVGNMLAAIDRFPSAPVVAPEFVDKLSQQARSTPRFPMPAVEFPPLVGRPHPGSAAEQLLEEHLSRCDWSAGRVWNQLHDGQLLELPIRVDLMWPELQSAVELDGPDHRGSLKYADDRRRDNTLVLAGFAVLRFTNDEVVGDTTRVVATIEKLLNRRRYGKGPRSDDAGRCVDRD